MLGTGQRIGCPGTIDRQVRSHQEPEPRQFGIGVTKAHIIFSQVLHILHKYPLFRNPGYSEKSENLFIFIIHIVDIARGKGWQPVIQAALRLSVLL